MSAQECRRLAAPLVVVLALGLIAAGIAGFAAGQAPAATQPAPPPAVAPSAPPPRPAPVLEPKAIEILKAVSARLAAAKTLSFTAVTTYESPSIYGAPLAYTTTSEVAMQRPDKLRVVTAGDGPATEFYYDGKAMMLFAPAENLVAVADAPPSLNAMFEALYDASGTYYPFSDYLTADPWADVSKNLTLAFYIGPSIVVGGVPTDMVAYESEGVFVQLWVGAKDRLPRMARAVYFDDPLQLRHQVELSNWKVDAPVAPGAFASDKAKAANRIGFAHPQTQSKRPSAAPAAPAAKPKSP